MYKHRKYELSVKLMHCTARSSKVIVNNKPLTLCIGVFDKDGNWVNENLASEPILKGMTQANLYEGKAEFPRLLFN